MEKILDKDFRNELFRCLKESGMKDKEVSGIINKRYKEALKDAVIEHFKPTVYWHLNSVLTQSFCR